MLAEALHGILARLPGRDQERPVRRFEQQQLTRGLVEHAANQLAAVVGFVLAGEALHLCFGVVDRLPHPVCVVVVPGEMSPARAPTAFGQVDHLLRRVVLDVIGGGRQIDFVAVREQAQHLLEPFHTLKPPVTEEFGVVVG